MDNDGDVDGRDFLVWQRGGSHNTDNLGSFTLTGAPFTYSQPDNLGSFTLTGDPFTYSQPDNLGSFTLTGTLSPSSRGTSSRRSSRR